MIEGVHEPLKLKISGTPIGLGQTFGGICMPIVQIGIQREVHFFFCTILQNVQHVSIMYILVLCRNLLLST